RAAIGAFILHPLQLGEQRAEQLDLAGVADLPVRPHGFDLREQEVFGSRVAGEVVETLVPGNERRVLIRQAIPTLLPLDETRARSAASDRDRPGSRVTGPARSTPAIPRAHRT